MNAMRQAAAKHALAANHVAGEPLRLHPQRAGGMSGGAGGPDPDRAAIEFEGTVTRRSLTLHRSGSGAQGATNVEVASAAWRVGFPAAAALDVRPGDHVERLDPPEDEPARLKLFAASPIRGRTIHPAEPVPS